MFLLPAVFFCNAVLFAVIFEERFKIITTLLVYILSFIISISIDGIISVAYPDEVLRHSISIGVNIFVLIIAAIFVSSNNLAQKLLLAISLFFNYKLCDNFLSNYADMSSAVGLTFLYIVVAIIILAVFTGPMHYFYRRSMDLTSIVICIIAFIGIAFADGTVISFINVETGFAEVLITSIPIFVTMICLRTSYSMAKQKEKDLNTVHAKTIQKLMVDNFNGMLVNLNSIKRLRQNSIGNRNNGDPLLQIYCENPNLNAVVATKIAYASSLDIKVKSNIAVDVNSDNVLSLCSVASHLIDIATSATINNEDNEISLSMQQYAGGVNCDLIYYEEEKLIISNIKSINDLAEMVKSMTIKSVLDEVRNILLENVFKQNLIKDEKYDLLVALVSANKGKMRVTSSNNKKRIKVSI